MDFDKINPYDIIYVGETKCVVCRKIMMQSKQPFLEVVYINDANKAIGKQAYWGNGKWVFPNQDGAYADKYSRFAPFIAHLKRHYY